MKKIDIICNTSPIIGLISIDRLYLLWDLFGSIIIPEAVFNELCADSVNHQDEIKRIKECVNSGKIITRDCPRWLSPATYTFFTFVA